MKADVFKLLIRDHKVINDVLDHLDETSKNTSEKTQKKLLSALQKELMVHKKFKEDVFYPSLQNSIETKNLITELSAEYDAMDKIIDKMQYLSTSSAEWKDNLATIKKYIDHHAQKEEGSLFPKAKKILTVEEVDNMTRTLRVLQENM